MTLFCSSLDVSYYRRMARIGFVGQEGIGRCQRLCKGKIISTWISGGFREEEVVTSQIRCPVHIACQNLGIASMFKGQLPYPS